MSRSGGYLGGSTILYFSPYETGSDRSSGNKTQPQDEWPHRVKRKSQARQHLRLVQIERDFVASFAKASVSGSRFAIPKACRAAVAKYGTILAWIQANEARRRRYAYCMRIEERRAGVPAKPRTGRILERL